MHDLPKLFYCDKLVQFERKKSKKGEFAFEEDSMQLLQLQKKKKKTKALGLVASPAGKNREKHVAVKRYFQQITRELKGKRKMSLSIMFGAVCCVLNCKQTENESSFPLPAHEETIIVQRQG